MSAAAPPQDGVELASVRRMMQDSRRKLSQWDGLFQELCRVNQETNDRGQAHIDHLENQIRQLESELARLREKPGLWSRLRVWNGR